MAFTSRLESSLQNVWLAGWLEEDNINSQGLQQLGLASDLVKSMAMKRKKVSARDCTANWIHNSPGFRVGLR